MKIIKETLLAILSIAWFSWAVLILADLFNHWSK